MQATAARQKKTVSVTLEPMLVQQAKDAGINLSATLAEALQSKLKPVQRKNGNDRIVLVFRS